LAGTLFISRVVLEKVAAEFKVVLIHIIDVVVRQSRLVGLHGLLSVDLSSLRLGATIIIDVLMVISLARHGCSILLP